MSIFISELVINIISLLFFKAENGYRTIFSMDTVEIAISDIIENHVESAFLHIGLKDFLRYRRFCLTSVFGLPTKLPHFKVLTLTKIIGNDNFMVAFR